jgi:sugar diacid utilization regulator
MRAEVLEELVHASRPPSAGLARRALRLGYAPGVPVRLVAIEIVSGTSGSDALHHDVREVLERDATARGTGPAMTYERTGRIVAALPGEADCDDAAVHLHDQLTAVGWSVAMGVGRASTDLVSARSEAFACLELTRKAGATAIVDAARLGPLRFMLDEPDLASGVAVVRERLTPLVGADRNGDGSLLETARAYADADGHQRTTTARCGIHVNTLKYRLARIEELVGYSLRDPERRYALRLAFLLLDLLQTLGLKPLDSRSDGDAR